MIAHAAQPRIHPTALVEEGVRIGPATAVWDSVHIRSGAVIGSSCIIGEKTYIANDVFIGDFVKVNAFVYVCAGVTIENGVMVSAGTVFTNDRFPRATTPDLRALRSSDVDEHTRTTLVRQGATIGAQCTIGNDLVIGRFAMIGMGSVVTRSVEDFSLVIGNPAKQVGWVCRCGEPTYRFKRAYRFDHDTTRPATASTIRLDCSSCSRLYEMRNDKVLEILATV